MTRLLILALTCGALAACDSPKAKSCTSNSGCPANAICVQGICQTGVPSGGSASTVSGAARLTAGTKTMDATLGAPIAPAGAAGAKTLAPAENTR
jgi:hypothetical protein